jgi:hypothetical protein
MSFSGCTFYVEKEILDLSSCLPFIVNHRLQKYMILSNFECYIFYSFIFRGFSVGVTCTISVCYITYSKLSICNSKIMLN